MKRLISLLLVFIFVLSFIGCANSGISTEERHNVGIPYDLTVNNKLVDITYLTPEECETDSTYENNITYSFPNNDIMYVSYCKLDNDTSAMNDDELKNIIKTKQAELRKRAVDEFKNVNEAFKELGKIKGFFQFMK